MRPHIVALLLCVLFVLSALGPAAQAAPEDEEIPMLRLFFEKEQYAVGEQVNVSAEFSVNGRLEYADVPGVSVLVFRNYTFQEGPPSEWPDVIQLTPGARGKYTGSFTVEEAHVTKVMPVGEGLPLMGRFILTLGMASYTKSARQVDITTMALTLVEPGPVINVAVNDHFPTPGDTVTVTVTTTNGTVVDAADVVVGLSSYDGEVTRDLSDLTVVRQSTGVYKAEYTVPVDLTDATMYTVHAGASFSDYNASAYLSPMFSTGFMVNFYDIWFQNVSATDDETEVAMWIADLDGNPLEGIDIDLNIMVYLKAGGTDGQTLANTTDADGKAGFVISHAAAARLDVNGMVSDGTVYQSFYMEAVIDRSPPGAPVPDQLEDFLVEPWETGEGGSIFDMIKEPGDPVHVMYRVFNMSGPVPAKRINWYLIDREGFLDSSWTVIDSGFEVTDANGDFDLTFNVPDTDVNGWLLFEAVMWNSEDERYDRMETSEPLLDAGFFPRDENIEITVDRLTKDAPVEMRAKVPLPASYFIGHFFAVFDEKTGLSQWGQPMALGPETDDFNIVPLQKVGPDTFGIDKQLPEFFPEDQSIAFVVLSVDLELFQIKMNYIMMGYGESTTKGMDVTAPATEPINAGSEGTLEVVVENTGAGTDHYSVQVETGPDWLTWDPETVTVEPAEAGSFIAAVAVPSGIDENRYYFNITVTSDTDPTLTKTVETWVDVLVNGVEVSVDDAYHDAVRDETVEFVVTVKNTGQGNDTFAIALSGVAADWAIPSDSSVTLQEGGEAEIVIQVTVASDAHEGTYDITCMATSSDGLTNGSVEMSVSVEVNGVTVASNTPNEETWRDVAVTLEFEVTNDGQGADVFTLTIEGAQAAWATLSDGSINVAEGESGTVTVEVTPSLTADAGFYSFILRATSSDGVTNASASSSVHVWVTGVDIDAATDSMTGYRDEQVQFTIDVMNTGQERDIFTISHEGGSWAEEVLLSQTNLGLDPDASGTVTLTVVLDGAIDEGTYQVIVTATSEDGQTTGSVVLEVKVTVNGVEATLSLESVKVTKGEKKEVTLTIKNTGQGSDTFTVLLQGAASNWTEADKTTLTLDEGATGTVTLTISPGKGEKGKAEFLDITVVSTDPVFNEKAQVQVVMEEPEDEGGLSTAMLIGIVVIVIVIIAVLVYMMQAKGD